MLYYQFQLLTQADRDKCLRHGIFPRKDSDGKSLNVDLNLPGYKLRDVLNSRKRIVTELGLSSEAYVDQNHENEILLADKSGKIGVGDGLITHKTGLGLLVKVADCQPVMFFAPKHKMVGMVHCGWRGAVTGILQNAVLAFNKAYSIHPQDLFVGIGPSLRVCCAQFSKPYDELPERFHKFIHANNKVDLPEISLDILLKSGIPREQIEIANICTACNNDTWFSYRADAETAQGRFAAVIGLV